jgi:hypothetical protein
VPLIVFVVGGLITASGIMLGRLARSRSKAIDVESVQAW